MSSSSNRWPDTVGWTAFGVVASVVVGVAGATAPEALFWTLCGAVWLLMVAIGWAMAQRQ